MSQSRRTLAVLACTAVLAASAAFAAGTVFDVDKAHSSMTFSIRHLLTQVQGRFRVFEGNIEYDAQNPAASRVQVTVQAASIDTGVEKRDNDLRSPNFFDAAKFPTLEFKSEKVVAKGKDELEVTGPFTMHGVTKTITVPVKVLGVMNTKNMGQKAGFEAHFTLSRKDFGITWNQALDSGGLLLGEDVAITINIEANARTAGSKS